MDNNNNKSPIDILIDKGYSDVIIFSEPSFYDALIGLTGDYNAVYDYDLMIDWLMTHEDMDVEEAADFINFNDSFYYGKHYPVIYYGEDLEEELAYEDPEYVPLVFTRIEDLPDKTN
jgi:hypothetical protein